MAEPPPPPDDVEAALAELLEVASLMVSSFVWSPEALPLAERLAVAVNRVTELTEGWRGDSGQEGSERAQVRAPVPASGAEAASA